VTSPARAQHTPELAPLAPIARACASTRLGEVARPQAAQPPRTRGWGHLYFFIFLICTIRNSARICLTSAASSPLSVKTPSKPSFLCSFAIAASDV